MCIPCPYTGVYHVTLDTSPRPTGLELILRKSRGRQVNRPLQTTATLFNQSTPMKTAQNI